MSRISAIGSSARSRSQLIYPLDCSVAGSVVIVGGLYLVLWGKGRETKTMRDASGKETEAEHEEGAIAAVGLTMFPSPPVFASPIHEAQPGQP